MVSLVQSSEESAELKSVVRSDHGRLGIFVYNLSLVSRQLAHGVDGQSVFHDQLRSLRGFLLWDIF